MSLQAGDWAQFIDPNCHPNVQFIVHQYGLGPYRVVNVTDDYALVEYSPGNENVCHIDYLREVPHPHIISGISKRDAYEANKTSDVCVRCGNPTVQASLHYSVVNHCKCVDEPD